MLNNNLTINQAQLCGEQFCFAFYGRTLLPFGIYIIVNFRTFIFGGLSLRHKSVGKTSVSVRNAYDITSEALLMFPRWISETLKKALPRLTKILPIDLINTSETNLGSDYFKNTNKANLVVILSEIYIEETNR